MCIAVSKMLLRHELQIAEAMQMHYTVCIFQPMGVVMAKAAVVTESTLTDRFQTTVPAMVRKALQLNKRDKLQFTVLDNGTVVLSRVAATEADPVLASFLAFLEQDMAAKPQHILPLSAQSKAKADKLLAGVDIDLDALLSPEDD